MQRILYIEFNKLVRTQNIDGYCAVKQLKLVNKK